jgi:hypothetical protein
MSFSKHTYSCTHLPIQQVETERQAKANGWLIGRDLATDGSEDAIQGHLQKLGLVVLPSYDIFGTDEKKVFKHINNMNTTFPQPENFMFVFQVSLL